MIAADTPFFFTHSHKDFQMWTLLQTVQAYPNSVLVVGPQALVSLILLAPTIELVALLSHLKVFAMQLLHLIEMADKGGVAGRK